MDSNSIEWLTSFADTANEKITSDDVARAEGLLRQLSEIEESAGRFGFGSTEGDLMAAAERRVRSWRIWHDMQLREEANRRTVMWERRVRALDDLASALSELTGGEVAPPDLQAVRVPSADELQAMGGHQLDFDVNRAEGSKRHHEEWLSHVQDLRESLTGALKGDAMRSVTKLLDVMEQRVSESLTGAEALLDALRGEAARRASLQAEEEHKADYDGRISELEEQIRQLFIERDKA